MVLMLLFFVFMHLSIQRDAAFERGRSYVTVKWYNGDPIRY